LNDIVLKNPAGEAVTYEGVATVYLRDTAGDIKKYISEPKLQSKVATENGTVIPDGGFYALSRVDVNLPIYSGEKEMLTPWISFTIDYVPYKADVGMIWDTWIESAYNTRAFRYSDDEYVWNDTLTKRVVNADYDLITTAQEIADGGTYFTN
jgi:hypothetical protein